VSLLRAKAAAVVPVAPDLAAQLAAINAKLDALAVAVTRLEAIEAHVSDLVLGRRGAPPAPRLTAPGARP
jgi:hypothetical protein